MEWLVPVLIVAACVAGIVMLARRAASAHPAQPEPRPDDPHAATLAEVNAQSGPRIYDG